MIPWDNTPGLGVHPFEIKLAPNHPFYGPMRVHDAQYQLLKEGRAKKTLKEIDRDFLKDCLRAAAFSDLWIDKFMLARQAWGMYRLCRLWAKYMRPELEKFTPRLPS